MNNHLLTECIMQWAHEEFPGCDPRVMYATMYGSSNYTDGICLWGYPIFEISEDTVNGLKSVSWPVNDLKSFKVLAIDPELFKKLKEFVEYYKKQYVDT